MTKRFSMAPSLILVVLLLAAGCNSDGDGPNASRSPAARNTGAPPATQPAEEEEGDGPSVSITSPAEGATVQAGPVEVKVNPSNFQVVNKLGQAPARGEGHVHYYLNVADLPTEPGKPAVSAENTYHASATTSYTWPFVEPGEHTFAVQLVNNDHTPLSPPVTRSVKVRVA